MTISSFIKCLLLAVVATTEVLADAVAASVGAVAAHGVALRKWGRLQPHRTHGPRPKARRTTGTCSTRTWATSRRRRFDEDHAATQEVEAPRKPDSLRTARLGSGRAGRGQAQARERKEDCGRKLPHDGGQSGQSRPADEQSTAVQGRQEEALRRGGAASGHLRGRAHSVAAS